MIWYNFIYVMKERTPSIFRVEEKVKQPGSTVHASLLFTSLTYSSTLKMEAVYSPESSVNSIGLYVVSSQNTADTLHVHRSENI
jgi:hypothetical protein